MTRQRAQVVAHRYVADLISSTPPLLPQAGSDEMSRQQSAEVMRVLNGIRKRLLAEADLLEQL